MTEQVARTALRDPAYFSASCWNYDCGQRYRPTTLEQKYCSRDCKAAANQTYRNRRNGEA